MIVGWLLFIEECAPDFPIEWNEMTELHHDAISLLLTLKKLINDNSFHWLRYFTNTNTWLDACLENSDVKAIKKSIWKIINKKK